VDVAQWLRNLSLDEYEALFRENHIDGSVLSALTTEDLKELGIASVGHRRKLLYAIAALRAGAAAVRPTSNVATEAERRQLTLMFCDLVGSPPLASRFDPEDLRDIFRAYHRTVTEAIVRFDGFVAKYMGDGVLAYFGYLQAHEDGAERAVRAGLGIIDAVARLESPGEPGRAHRHRHGARRCRRSDRRGRSAGARRRQPVRGLAYPPPSQLVGREEEIEILLRRWTCARAGTARSCCCRVRRALASRAWSKPSRSGSSIRRAHSSAGSARRTIRIARFTR